MANKKISQFPLKTTSYGSDIFLIDQFNATCTVAMSTVSGTIIDSLDGTTAIAKLSGTFIQKPTTPTAGQVLTYNGSTSTWVASAAPTNITSGTAVTLTNQTSVDFTGIPSWVKRVTVMFRNTSSNGLSYYQVQLGTSSGVENTGYLGTGAQVSGSIVNVAISTGFSVPVTNGTWVTHGMFTIVKLYGNVYVASGQLYASATSAFQWSWGGSKSLSGVLDRIRLTTVNGTDQFVAGTVNIMWE